MIKMHLQFPDDPAWVDVSHLVRPFSYRQTITLMNDACESVIDTASVTLKYDQLMTARIMASPGGSKIRCLVFTHYDQPLFSGVISPGLRQQKHKLPGDIPLEVRDDSWRLDAPLDEDFQMPFSIDDTPVAVRDAYEAILLAAGYEELEIYPDGIAADEQVRMISVVKDSCTYRQLLDSLLRDYGYVFTLTADGRFSLYRWSRDEFTPDGTVDQELSVVDPLEVSKEDSSHDGIELEWSSLDVLDEVRLFSANLPVGADEASSGVTILPGRYYPEDGDIVETYQNYRTEWLDEPYQARKTRIRNRDITLITSEAHRLLALHDPGIEVVEEHYEKHRCRVLFHNPTPEAQKLYVFEVYGRALFRSSKRETLMPSQCSDSRRVQSEYIFSLDDAKQLILGLYRLQHYGALTYQFTLRSKEYVPGDVVTIHQDDPALDTHTLITEVSWIDGQGGYRYRSRGVSPFGDIQAITTAYQSAKSGKGEQGEAGADAYQLVILSDRGNLFRPQELETTLFVRVYQGGVNVTDQFSDEDFRWTRESDNPESDAVWNSYHYSLGGKSIQVTTEDVYRRAVFSCTLLKKL